MKQHLAQLLAHPKIIFLGCVKERRLFRNASAALMIIAWQESGQFPLNLKVQLILLNSLGIVVLGQNKYPLINKKNPLLAHPTKAGNAAQIPRLSPLHALFFVSMEFFH